MYQLKEIKPALAAMLRRRAATASPVAFARLVTQGKYEVPPHLALLNRKLLEVAAGRKRLLVEMPPRSGKSWLISKYFPAWYIGSNPDNRIILSSYEADFAGRWGGQARDLLQEHGGLFGVRVNPDSSSSARWDIAGRAGGMNAVGIGGPITGKGCHVFVIDDPLKNSEQAHSETEREKQWDWFRSVAYTRLEPNASIVLTMARWHSDDLAGRLLEEADCGGERWDVLRLPAIAEEGDPLGREPGAALWPERFGVDDLESIRRTVGSRAWASLYQQSPVPEGGNIIQRDWFRYWTKATLPPKFDSICQSWDLSFKGGHQNDFVCGQVWGLLQADRYLLDQVHRRMDFPATIAAMRMMQSKWPATNRTLVEDTANGAALVATLQHEISGLLPVRPEGTKEARVHACSAMIESGNVYLPEDAPWADDFISECVTFPAAKNDDMVDAMSQLLNSRAAAYVFFCL